MLEYLTVKRTSNVACFTRTQVLLQTGFFLLCCPEILFKNKYCFKTTCQKGCDKIFQPKAMLVNQILGKQIITKWLPATRGPIGSFSTTLATMAV